MISDEVRSLAKRSQESTNEIQEMITALLGGTRRVVESIERTSVVVSSASSKCPPANSFSILFGDLFVQVRPLFRTLACVLAASGEKQQQPIELKVF